MKFPYKEIVIIYNPNSTGDSKANAQKLAKDLRARIHTKVSLVPTKHAGHAETIARRYAQAPARTLLVSSSGDGGYNEVINGVLHASTNNATTYVLPSGNANDHHHATKKGDSVEQIIKAAEITIEVIKVEATINGKPWTRYAHSYVGIGLTAHVGKKLTEAKLNALNEKFIVLKYVALFRHVTIWRLGKKRRYTSVVFATIQKMSKILKLTGSKSLRDGKMEIYELKERSTLSTFIALLTGSTRGFAPSLRTNEYSFATTRALPIQLDGEVFVIDKNADVTVRCVNQVLRVIH